MPNNESVNNETRIIDQPADTTLQAGDCVMVDSQSEGTRKYDLGGKLLEIDSDLDEKVEKVAGKGLSTEDYTTEEKTKLSGVEAGANKTIIDTTLSEAGWAADAKKTGDAIDAEAEARKSEISGLTEELTGALTYDSSNKKIVVTLPETA